MIPSIAASENFAAQVSQRKQIWYEPATVSTAVPTTGNPFSADENDVQATFNKGKLAGRMGQTRVRT